LFSALLAELVFCAVGGISFLRCLRQLFSALLAHLRPLALAAPLLRIHFYLFSLHLHASFLVPKM
jgi:hypothetical protein